MTNRHLFLLAAGLASLIGLFYYLSGEVQQVPQVEDLSVDYQASQISLIQTDAQGRVSSRLQASDLRHFVADDRVQLRDLEGEWLVNQALQAQFSAQQATGWQQQGSLTRLEMQGAVNLQQPAQNNRPAVQMRTESLQAYPQTRLVRTQTPVQFTSGGSTLAAAGFSGNLNTRQFDFERVRGQYVAR